MVRRIVGRGSEVAHVRSVIATGAVAALIGPAGIGKTAIATCALDGRAHAVGRGLATLRGRQYAALEPVVRDRLSGDPDDVAERLLDRIDGVLLVEDLHWMHPRSLEALGLLVGRVPMIVTTRPNDDPVVESLLARSTRIPIERMSERDAELLSHQLHPGLDARDRRRLLTAAGGTPLLIERLVDPTGHISSTLVDAISERLDRLEPAARHATEIVALLGRPVTSDLAHELGSIDSDLLLTNDDGHVELAHAAIAAAVVDLTAPNTRRDFHRWLADRLDDREGSAHDLASGNHQRAADRAIRAAAHTNHLGDRAALLQIAADANAALGRDDRVLRVLAAEAFVDAGQWQDAIRNAELVTDDGSLEASDALLQQARARWNLGEVPTARELLERASSLVSQRDPARAARITVEQGYLEVRDRTPGATQQIAAAVDATIDHPVEHLHARASYGAALLYDGHPDWERVLREALDDAANEPELASTIAYHLISGLGFHGRFDEALDIDRRFIDYTARLGLRRSTAHFQQAGLMHRSMIDQDVKGVLADAEAHLAAHRLFRNRFLVHMVKVLALLDLARIDDARAAIDAFEGEGCVTPEQVATAAAVRAELAWHADDPDLAGSALELGRPVADAYFGLHLLTERTAAHVLAEHGEAVEPVLPSVSMPAWWPALHELEGLKRLVAGDAVGAQTELAKAADCWEAMQIGRWAVRSGALAAEVGGRRSAPARRRHYVALARAHGLVGTLRRLGHPVHPSLTITEERVLREIARGASTRVVAAELGISSATVDHHVESARRKLGAATRIEAALLVEP